MNKSREWRVECDRQRRGDREFTSFCICVKGVRGAMHEVLFHTPQASHPSKIERLEQAAIVASAAEDLKAALEPISAALDRGEAVTIMPMSKQHITLRRSVIKAQGQL